jgi:hypothetical protein
MPMMASLSRGCSVRRRTTRNRVSLLTGIVQRHARRRPRGLRLRRPRGSLHGGWQDNEGAYGALTIDVATRTATLDFNARIIESHNTTTVL